MIPGKSVLFFICLILAISTWGTETKKTATVVQPAEIPAPHPLNTYPRLASGDTCTVGHHVNLSYYIQNWVTGGELYKSYQDPGLSCPNAYPFSVEEVLIVLHIHQPCILNVSVDVESVDLTQPSCPFPGELLSISQSYAYQVPDSNLYLLSVPLDSAVTINEPYFVGFYLDYLDILTKVDLVTDNIPVLCTGYNIWDDQLGYVDVTNNDYFNFPGRMVLYSAGTAGGGAAEPEPAITLLAPGGNTLVPGDVIVWGAEISGSSIIDYVIFDYRGAGGWTQIGYDYDASRPVRNGVDPSGSGTGFSLTWNYADLIEGTYWLKATVFDTLNRSDSDSLPVLVDPTPPELTFDGTPFLGPICPQHLLAVTSDDENITQIKFENKTAAMNYQPGVATFSQSVFGADGANFCGPVAGAIGIKYWYDRGYSYCMSEGTTVLPLDTVVERLAAVMLTRENGGTYDEQFYLGLNQYILAHGNELRLGIHRRPDYRQFRALFQEQELCVILALSGIPGLYLVAAGVSGTGDAADQYDIAISDPISGQLLSTFVRNSGDGAQVYYNNSWHDLDMIFTLKGYALSVTRDLIGIDNDGGDGWSREWDGDLMQDSLYFVVATATDATGNTGTRTTLVRYDCVLENGDYNGDGLVNLGDALYLIEFIFKGGEPPSGGAGRADANCDTFIDISDVLYVIKFIYGTAPQPCY
ncbi:MAG: hypothetical protein JSV44_07905 [Candidatus Zixiibacteriota bacterium]|nr:MAG: hypothetical protein JSV44_07905 [candidate division Zixibacteria bacterium]